jgi:hypothetical protein
MQNYDENKNKRLLVWNLRQKINAQGNLVPDFVGRLEEVT